MLTKRLLIYYFKSYRINNYRYGGEAKKKSERHNESLIIIFIYKKGFGMYLYGQPDMF